MKIAVTDANIFIDLIEIEILQCLFELGMEIHTTRAVYDQLTEVQKRIIDEFLSIGKLIIYNLSFDDLKEIYIIDFPTGLDPVDKSVFYYAQKVNAIILSGDKKLKLFCEKKAIEVKDINWVFDKMVAQELLPKNIAAQKLDLLLSINDRLPFDDCRKRINKWGAV